MACNNFEVSGLLYLSGELGAEEAKAYEAHLAGCAECRRETEEYRKERASLYTAEVLGDYPSEAVDNEILRVCANPKKMLAGTALTPMLFIKKYAPVPIFLMLVMVAVGGYVRHHSMSAESLRAKLIDESAAAAEVLAANPAAPAEQNAAGENANSEQILAGNQNDSDQTPARSLGDMNMKGVHTVSGRE